MNTPEETWQALLEGRDAITDLPEGRWTEFLEEPRIAERVAKARTRGGYLKDIKGFDSEFFALSKMEADNLDPQQRMALELDLGGIGTRPHPGVEPARRERRRLHRLVEQRLQLPGGVRPDRRASVRDHRHRELDHRQPGVLLLRLPRSVGGGRHRVLELAGRRAPGRAGAAGRRVRRRSGRRRERTDHPDGDDRVRRGRRRAGGRRPDQVVLLGRRRLLPRRGRRHAGVQAGRRRPPRRRPDPGRDRGQRGQP